MRTGSRKKQEGAVAIVVALSMIFLLGIAALAIDIGNLMVARNELQNAADAAALAGAGCLYKRTECGNTAQTEPTWADAENTASGFATQTPSTNLVQGKPVQVVSTASGYWNVTGTPGGLQVPGTFKPGNNDMPAIQVTVLKDGSDANGAVPVYLGTVLGAKFLKASAVATAVISRPGNVGPGGLFPIAIPQCMYTNYWDSVNNVPKTYQGTAIPGQTEPQTMNQPFVFDMMSSYHTDKCAFSAQWTSFNDQSAQSAKTSKDLIQYGNQVPLGIGSPTWIQSGTKDTLFQLTQACSAKPNGDGTCEYVTVPVVDSVATPGQNQTIQAFACLHILNEVGNGSSAHIIAQMSADQSKCLTANSGGIGPNYGAITPPRLVQ